MKLSEMNKHERAMYNLMNEEHQNLLVEMKTQCKTTKMIPKNIKWQNNF